MAGARVIVTRPVGQAISLAEAIVEAGGIAIRLPAIEIVDPTDREQLDQSLGKIVTADFAVFVSTNAVERAFPLLQSRAWPKSLRFAAVGKATAQALKSHGASDVTFPSEKFDSESLLEMLPPELVGGKRILIFRGENGRTVLADALLARGAVVEHVVCYRRQAPDHVPKIISETINQGGFDITTALSVETIENLLAVVDSIGRDQIRRKPLLVASDRARAEAMKHGFTSHIEVAAQASDEAVMEALRAWRQSQNHL